jgi:type III pantothenate kinase
VLRIVADLGNSRLKWGLVAPDGSLAATDSTSLHDAGAWESKLSAWNTADGPVAWAISSVNPPAAERLARFLAKPTTSVIHWYRSADDVPIRHELLRPETTGADRALAVLAATKRRQVKGPMLIVACGTAITVERVDGDSIWHGGAIAPGLALAALALNRGTAQLPHIVVEGPPDPWGRASEPALAAGIFWGTVGAIRELLTRQTAGLSPRPRVVFTGGDATILSSAVDWPGAQIVPDLVLQGLAIASFVDETR